MNMREEFEATELFRELPLYVKEASEEGYLNRSLDNEFKIFCLGYKAAQAQQESRIVYLWRQRNRDDDNAWIDGSKELHGWMSKDKKYETRVLYEKPASKGDKE